MKKKIIIPVSIAGIAAIGIAIAALTSSASKVAVTETELLEKLELQSTLSLTGTVESSTVKKIYTTLPYKVEKVNVEVGDAVKKGDILCTLDSNEIETQIVKQKKQIELNNIDSDYQLTEAEKSYKNALDDYNNNMDYTVLTAKNNLDSAEDALTFAKINYDQAVKIKNTDKDTNIKTLETQILQNEEALNKAKAQLKISKEKDTLYKTSPSQDYEKDYQQAKEKFLRISSGLDSDEFKSAKETYDNAVNAYEYYLYLGDADKIAQSKQTMETASAQLDAVIKSEEYANVKDEYDRATLAYLNKKYLDTTTDDYQRQVDMAQKALDSSKESLEQVKSNNVVDIDMKKKEYVSAQRQLELAKQAYDNAVTTAESNLSMLKKNAEMSRLNSDNDTLLIDLQNLMDTLDECTVKSPVDGVVTAVYAVEDASGAGLLFVVEDVDSLKITSMVKQYDISYLEDGQTVTIRSDSINSDEEYNGIVSNISPTAIKGPLGDDAGSGNFSVDVSVSDRDTKLKIGTTAKLTVITAEKNDVYTVKYESLCEDKDGNSYIFVADNTDTGYVAKKISVTTGIESDFTVEIISDELKDGLYVITNPEYITDGQPVNINTENAEADKDEVAE